MTFSFFNHVRDTDCSNTSTITDVYNSIQKGEWEDLVLRVRASKTDQEKRDFKSKLPAFTTSGIFNSRTDKGLVQHSGLIAIDFDNISFEQSAPLRKDRYSFSGFVSASGYGYCIIVKIPPDKHRESFRQLSEYYYATYGIQVDASGINESRLRYVSYDPEAFINYNASLFIPKSAQKPKKQPTFVPCTVSDFEEAVTYICTNGIDITQTYEDWLYLSFAIESEFKESGRHYFHAISQMSAKYDAVRCDKQYTHSLNHAGSGVSIGTFWHLCRKYNVPFNLEKSQKIAKAAVTIRKAKGNIHDIANVINPSAPPVLTEDEIKLAKKVYEMPEDQVKEIEREDKPNRIELARLYINSNHDIWIEEFSGRIYKKD